MAGDGDGAKKKSPEGKDQKNNDVGLFYPPQTYIMHTSTDRLRDAASVCITNPTVIDLLVNYGER